jgi:trimeric autotransporter adhesin
VKPSGAAEALIPAARCGSIRRGRARARQRRYSVPFVLGLLALLMGLLLARPIEPAAPALRGAASVPRARTSGRVRSLPLQAQPAISTTLGSGDARFAASRTDAGYRLTGGGVSAELGSAGAVLRARGGSVSLALAGVGHGERLSPVRPASQTAHGNRVTYDRAGLQEWYAAGPLGIEQGFTIARRPAGGGPLTLALSLGGSLRAQGAGSQIVFRTSSGLSALRYGALSVVDASGRKLPASLALSGHSLLLRIDDRGARYPLRIDPFVQQEVLSGALEEEGKGEFGWSVALSEDGNTALIGAPADHEHTGAAWVFTRSGETWSPGEKLTAREEPPDGSFGFAVALSANGETALIGGYPHAEGGSGAAWIFTRTGSEWKEQKQLTEPEGQGPSSSDFGSSVALSANGETALIGGFLDKERGAAWVYTRSGGTWPRQAELTGNEEVGGCGGVVGTSFGLSVALSEDGNTALIGGPGDNGCEGAAWVFTRSGETWSQQGKKLTGDCVESPCEGPSGTGEEGKASFGESVALSADGETALIGGPDNYHEKLGEIGAAWVFTRSGEAWSQQGERLTAGGEEGEAHFGESVALSPEGNLALIGGPYDSDKGAAWLFTRSGGTWSQQGEKLTTPSEECGAHFGEGVALSSAGETALVGSYGEAHDTGAAFVFTSSMTTTTTATTTCTTTTTSTPSTETTSSPSTTTTSSTTTAAPTSSTRATMPAPVLSDVAESHRVWRESKGAAKLGKKARSAVGTTFSFALNEQATVTFTFSERLPGHTAGHACVASNTLAGKRGKPKRKACIRTVVAGRLAVGGHAGKNSLFFGGQLARSKKLRPGSYTVAISAQSAAGERSSTARLAFTIVAGANP